VSKAFARRDYPAAGSSAVGWISESDLVELERLAHVCRDVPNGRLAPRLDPVKNPVYPIKLIAQLRMTERNAFFDKLCAYDCTKLVAVEITAILGEPVTKVIDARRDSLVLFSC
jgi:hypothetical protein